MFVVLDTNVLVKEMLLNSSSGAAVRYFIRHGKGTLVMPEVIEFEIRKHLRRSMIDYIADIDKQHRKLLALFDTLREVVLPTPDDVDRRVRALVDSIDVDVIKPEFNLSVARSSFEKIVNEDPPSDKNQQFKDGVIWAHCVDLLDTGDVHLVTDDKAFFKSRDHSQGLASNLLREVESRKHKLVLHASLEELLNDISGSVTVDELKLVESFELKQPAAMMQLAKDAGFERDGKPTVEFQAFATEKSTRLYLKFSIGFHCVDVRGEGRLSAYLKVHGDGVLDTALGEFVDLQRQGEEIVFEDSNGHNVRRSAIMGMGPIYFGHRTVEHTVRVPLVMGSPAARGGR